MEKIKFIHQSVKVKSIEVNTNLLKGDLLLKLFKLYLLNINFQLFLNNCFIMNYFFIIIFFY
jgi:hypothetical protein